MPVTALPPALAPWAQSLSLFPREMAIALGPLLPRLAAVLGEGTPADGEGKEPDGYDGLSRRGPYDRLLTSEWLLLSEAPEELVRRMSAGELSFLHLALRAGAAPRHAAILFDAGPEQLGAPRIAHLAALIVLAARVAKQRGTLSWGVLQDESLTMYSIVSTASVEALLAARSPRIVKERDVAAWLEVPAVAGASERWLVSSEDIRPPGAARTTSMLVVADMVEIDARRLRVTAMAAGASRPREALLELPDARASVRLLRDPFKTRVAPTATAPEGIDLKSGIVLSEDGRRLYMRGRKGELFTQVVPNSPRMPAPLPAVFVPPEGQVVVAAGLDPSVHRSVAVCFGEGAYHVHRLTRAGRGSYDTREHPCEEGPAWDGKGASPLDGLSFGKDGLICFVNTATMLLRGGQVRGDIEHVYPPQGMFRVERALKRSRKAPLKLGEASLGDGPARAVRLDVERTRVEIDSGASAETLFTTASPIEDIVMAEGAPLIAYLTEAGDIGVYSLSARAMVLRMSTEVNP